MRHIVGHRGDEQIKMPIRQQPEEIAKMDNVRDHCDRCSAAILRQGGAEMLNEFEVQPCDRRLSSGGYDRTDKGRIRFDRNADFQLAMTADGVYAVGRSGNRRDQFRGIDNQPTSCETFSHEEEGSEAKTLSSVVPICLHVPFEPVKRKIRW